MDDAGEPGDWLRTVASDHGAHRDDGYAQHIVLPRVDTSTAFPSLPPMQLASPAALPSADFTFAPTFPGALARSGSFSSDGSASHLPVSPQSAHVGGYGSLSAIEARQGKRSRIDDDDGGESPPASIAPALTQSPGAWAPVDVRTLPVIDLGNTSANGGPFPHKLYNLCINPDTQHLISWTAGGASFRIHDPAAFTSDVLPIHFKHRCVRVLSSRADGRSNLTSFVRQLVRCYRISSLTSQNMYGFSKARESCSRLC